MIEPRQGAVLRIMNCAGCDREIGRAEDLAEGRGERVQFVRIELVGEVSLDAREVAGLGRVQTLATGTRSL
ncbi:hypothetical protein [Nocardia sp. NPDC052112]|uniref:hypothetical protein n=1 Tax=Nocardia sp. NPDC052112 TaxID=3155646 RepID=UPI00342B2188